MPDHGEIRFNSNIVSNWFGQSITKKKEIWWVCPKCNQGRWVDLASTKRKMFTGLCTTCFGDLSYKYQKMLKEEIKQIQQKWAQEHPGEVYYAQ